jgi:hypothetical protein
MQYLPFVRTFQVPVVQQTVLLNSAPVAMLQPWRGNMNIRYNFTVYSFQYFNPLKPSGNFTYDQVF